MAIRRMNRFAVVLVALVVALALMPGRSVVWAAEQLPESSPLLRHAALDPRLQVRDPASVLPVLVQSSRQIAPAHLLATGIGDIRREQELGETSPTSTVWMSQHTWAKQYYNRLGTRAARHEATTQWFWSNGTIVAPGALWGSYTTWFPWTWENTSRWWSFVASNIAQAVHQVTFRSWIYLPYLPPIPNESFVSQIITTVDGWGNSWAQ